MSEPVLANDAISTLLLAAAALQEGHRRRALEGAAKAAWTWEEEAASLLATDRQTIPHGLAPLRAVT